MRKYYIEIDGKQSEPMGLEELKESNILKSTLIWYEGLEEWTAAGSIEELDLLFASVLPLKKAVPPVTPQRQVDNEVQENKSFMYSSRNRWLLGSFSIIAGVIFLISFTDKSQGEAAGQLHENTMLIEQQQQQLEEQNAKIAEQQRLEQQRQERERRETKEKRKGELNNDLTVAYESLEKATRKLNDATAFQLGRSSSQRNQQINQANENVRVWEEEIARVEQELKGLH